MAHQSVLKKDDFEDWGPFLVFLTNLTSKTSVNEPNGLPIIEVASNGIALKVARTACSVGHLMKGGIVLAELYHEAKSLPKKEWEKAWEKDAVVTFTAKVAELEKFGAQYVSIQLLFQQVTDKEWKSLLKDLQKSQDRSLSVFKRIKE